MKPAVLVMAKAPEAGRVKTRLAPLLGDEGCARLQAVLLERAVALARSVVASGSTFLAMDQHGAGGGTVGVAAPWLPPQVHTFPQAGEHLGEKLANAVEAVLRTGHRPVVVIGTDVPLLAPSHLQEAFSLLSSGTDVVFGPAYDGGYYLIGVAKAAPEIFGIPPELWGSPSVLEASLRRAEESGLATGLLAPLPDLDRPGDATAHLADPGLPEEVREVLTGATHDISIVVPVLNEGDGIAASLGRLRRDFPEAELVVVDGGSHDGTALLAASQAPVLRSARGRARQMNVGAQATTGEVIWFVHADVEISPGAAGEIRAAVADPAVVGGGLSLRFDRRSPALDYLAWSSNQRARHLHQIFGDQSMFVRRDAFAALGGFPEIALMEDLELSRRLRRLGRLVVLDATSTASARRFVEHGTFSMIAFMQYLRALYFLGADPEALCRSYAAGPPWKRSPQCQRT
jgi:rSAM/selenodomain-associated transferase 2/rSAM/selenodomain-associated transferase 1